MGETKTPEKSEEKEESNNTGALNGANAAKETEGKEEQRSEVIRVRDPLTYVFWGIMMLIYGGFLVRWGLMYPEANYWILLYLIQPTVFFIIGLYSIIYGIRRNKRVRVYTYKK